MTNGFRCIAAWAGLLVALACTPIGAQDNAATDGPQSSGGDAGFGGLIIKPVEERKNVTPIPPPPADAPPPSPDPRNLEGVWLRDGDVSAPMGEPPKFTPAAAAEQRRRQTYAAKGTPLGGLGAECRPSEGQILNLGYDLFPAEIIQTPEKIVILNEEGRGRWQIHLNRALPKQPPPSYSGHSVGRWDGDTLVVETIGIIDQWGMAPLTKNSRITHYIRKLDGGGRLELKTTVEDPELYAVPYRSTKSSTWHPELHLLEFQCEENREGAREGVLLEE